MDDLQQVAHSLEVSPNRLDAMCAVTSSPSQLLYYFRDTNKVHRVDCSTAPPTHQEETPIVYDGRQMGVWDMCTSGDLLVAIRWEEGIFAHTLPGGELRWMVSGKLPGMQDEICALGVTADDQGHLFACDRENRCVHVLSVRDGTHLGVVVREGDEGVGEPDRVAWHSDSASLIVANLKDELLSFFFGQD